MWKNQGFSILVGVGIGLAVNLQKNSLPSPTIVTTTTGDSKQPWKNLSSSLPSNETERPSTKQLSRAQRYQQARESIMNVGGGTQIVSDFIRDGRKNNDETNNNENEPAAKTLQKFAEAKNWLECHDSAMNHWLDKNDAPQDMWQELAVRIWKDHPIVTEDKFAGYEYWCNILHHDNPLIWHVDKDESVFYNTGRLVNPLMGAVYYGYPHRLEGGYLEIMPFDADEVDNPSEFYWRTDQVERIQPKYNRMVIFNVSKWHRVTPVTNGARFTFAVNLWKHKPTIRRLDPLDNNETKQDETTSGDTTIDY